MGLVAGNQPGEEAEVRRDGRQSAVQLPLEAARRGKRQNYLKPEHIQKIIDTYQQRPKEPIERYARRVEMDEIEGNDFNLNISRYVSTAKPEPEIDLAATHRELVDIEKAIQAATAKHNDYLKQLGLPKLP